jgi:RHS repeat-associated protein
VRFLYDGRNVVQTQNSAGSPTSQVLAGLNLDEWLARISVLGTASYLPDALGSTLALTNAAGATTAAFTYEPYGKTSKTGADDTSFRFTGREDDGTGLYYYRARYYHPGLGRFVTEDPIGLAGGINLYAYVRGNPVGYVDPLGLWGVGGVAGGTIEAGFGDGAGYQAASGAGVFFDSRAESFDAGAFTQSGGFSGESASGPVGTPGGQFVYGATGGAGGGVFFTNAESAQALIGPFDTWNLNLPFVSAQFASDGRVVVSTISFGRSWGISFSRYTVTTTWAGGLKCR